GVLERGGCDVFVRTPYNRHVRTQSDFEMAARRRRIFVSEISARPYVDIRRRPYHDGDGGPGLSRESGECRPGGSVRRFTLELSHAHVLGDRVQAEVRARFVRGRGGRSYGEKRRGQARHHACRASPEDYLGWRSQTQCG